MSYIISPPEDAALQAHLHKLRTQLHEDPELSWHEHRTTRLVRQELEALCLEPVPLEAERSEEHTSELQSPDNI